MKKLFILFGAAITLLPIFLGDLHWWEYLLGGIVLSFLGAAGAIMTYNFVKNNSKEQAGIFQDGIPYTERIIYSVVGSIIASVIAAICL